MMDCSAKPRARLPDLADASGASSLLKTAWLWGVTVLGGIGLASIVILAGQNYSWPHGTDPFIRRSLADVFLFLTVQHDLVWLAVVPVLLLVLLRIPGRLGPFADTVWRLASTRWGPTGLAALIFIGTAIGYHAVMGGFALSMDELMTQFQAQIFLEGHLWGRMVGAPEWFVEHYHRGFTPRMPEGLWGSAYLPGMAMVWAAFASLSAGPLSSALLSGGAVGLGFLAARQIWPERRDVAIVVALLLASAPQVWLTGMTSYAMAGHLGLNLLWLVLYLRGPRGRLVAPWVGFLAMGLHKPHIHMLFVLPFLVDMALRRRPSVIYYGIIYTLGFLLWKYWPVWSLWLEDASGSVRAWHDPFARIISQTAGGLTGFDPLFAAATLARFTAWQNPVTLVLVGAALVLPWWRHSVMRCLISGFFLTAGMALLFAPDQGHGWGARYLHGVLGNFVLVAAFAWASLVDAERSIPFRRAAVLASLVMLLVAIPLRAFQAKAFVDPYRQADAALHAIRAPALAVDAVGGWYAIDLVRNDPFLRQETLRIPLHVLPPDRLHDLCRTGQIRIVGSAVLAPLGLLQYPDAIRQLGLPTLLAADPTLETCVVKRL